MTQFDERLSNTLATIAIARATPTKIVSNLQYNDFDFPFFLKCGVVSMAVCAAVSLLVTL